MSKVYSFHVAEILCCCCFPMKFILGLTPLAEVKMLIRKKSSRRIDFSAFTKEGIAFNLIMFLYFLFDRISFKNMIYFAYFSTSILKELS